MGISAKMKLSKVNFQCWHVAFLSFEGSWSLLPATVGTQFTHNCTPAPIFPSPFSSSPLSVPLPALPPSLLIMWPWSQNCYPPHRVNPPPPASHNELFSHSGRAGQKWPAGEPQREREREGVRQRGGKRGRRRGGGRGSGCWRFKDGWNRGIQEERKLEGGTAAGAREWCKAMGERRGGGGGGGGGVSQACGQSERAQRDTWERERVE